MPFLVQATAAVRLQLDWCEHMQLVVILQVRETAKDIDGAMRELPDANMVLMNLFLLLVANTCSSTLSTCIFPFVNVWLCSPPLSWLAETRGLMGKAFIKCISKASQ